MSHISENKTPAYAAAAVVIGIIVAYAYFASWASNRSTVSVYPDEISAVRGEQERNDLFREKCAHVGFTHEQCVFFQKGAQAP